MEGRAEQAFEQLRAEVTVMRRIVEQLQEAIEAVPTVDYSPTLGEIAGTQAKLARHAEQIAEFTGSMSHAERLQQELAWARDTALQPAIKSLASLQHDARSAVQAMREVMRLVTLKQHQPRTLAVAVAIGVAIGLVVYPLVIQPALEAIAAIGPRPAVNADLLPTENSPADPNRARISVGAGARP